MGNIVGAGINNPIIIMILLPIPFPFMNISPNAYFRLIRII